MSSTAYFIGKDIVSINAGQIEDLKKAAQTSGTKRARYCLHRSHDDSIQQMVIAYCGDSYMRPHRNVKGSKSFFMIDGEIFVVIFNDEGVITEKIRLVPAGCGGPFICRLNINQWHTIVPLTEYAVFIETNGGPFVAGADEYAKWAPENDDAEGIKLFMVKVLV